MPINASDFKRISSYGKWRWLLFLLFLVLIVRIMEFSGGYPELNAYYSHLKLFRLVISAGVLLFVVWSVLRVVLLGFKSLGQDKYSDFVKDFSDFLTTLLRTLVTAPASFVYWLSGADYKLVKSKWKSDEEARKVFWRSDTQYFVAGFFILLIGVYIFSATVYFLMMLSPVESKDGGAFFLSIPVVGDLLGRVLNGVPEVVVVFAGVMAVWAMSVDRAIYSDKSIERYYWSYSRTDSGFDKPSARINLIPALSMFAIFTIRIFIAYLFSWFGAQAAELFFFQRDIDSVVAEQVENKRKVAIEESSELKSLYKEKEEARLRLGVAELALEYERNPPKHKQYLNVVACKRDSGWVFVATTGLQEGCVFPRPVSGDRGDGPHTKRIEEAVNYYRGVVKEKTSEIEGVFRGAEEKAKTSVAQNGYGKRLEVLAVLEKDGALDPSLIRRLVLTMELMPILLKMMSVLLLFYQSPISRYLLAIEDEFCDRLERFGVGSVVLEEPKEDKEKLLEKGISILHKYVPVLLFVFSPLCLYIYLPLDWKVVLKDYSHVVWLVFFG